MSPSDKALETQILSKSAGYRAYLAERILSSLDPPEQKKIDEHWSIEAEERIDAYQRGDIQAIEEEKAFEEFEKRLHK